jgi:hypothetical protein
LVYGFGCGSRYLAFPQLVAPSPHPTPNPTPPETKGWGGYTLLYTTNPRFEWTPTNVDAQYGPHACSRRGPHREQTRRRDHSTRNPGDGRFASIDAIQRLGTLGSRRKTRSTRSGTRARLLGNASSSPIGRVHGTSSGRLTPNPCTVGSARSPNDDLPMSLRGTPGSGGRPSAGLYPPAVPWCGTTSVAAPSRALPSLDPKHGPANELTAPPPTPPPPEPSVARYSSPSRRGTVLDSNPSRSDTRPLPFESTNETQLTSLSTRRPRFDRRPHLRLDGHTFTSRYTFDSTAPSNRQPPTGFPDTTLPARRWVRARQRTVTMQVICPTPRAGRHRYARRVHAQWSRHPTRPSNCTGTRSLHVGSLVNSGHPPRSLRLQAPTNRTPTASTPPGVGAVSAFGTRPSRRSKPGRLGVRNETVTCGVPYRPNRRYALRVALACALRERIN